MTLQPVTAGNRQGAGAISGLAKEAKKPYPEYSVRGRIVEGVGIGNLTQPVPLDASAKFTLAGIDPAKYQVELLNKKGKVVCTEGPFDLTKQPNLPGVVIDCGNPPSWWLLAIAAQPASPRASWRPVHHPQPGTTTSASTSSSRRLRSAPRAEFGRASAR